MAELSDEARLYWPFLYAGSNGYGYFELDYRKILERCFGQFNSKPPKELIVSLLREYRSCSLLFVYSAANGQRWAAWDSAAAQSFHTKEDDAAPKPPEPEFSNWKRLYQEQKHVSASEILDLDGEPVAIDTKNAEIDISPKSTDIDLKSTNANRTSRSVSESKHPTSVTSQHPNINARATAACVSEPVEAEVEAELKHPATVIAIDPGWPELLEIAQEAEMAYGLSELANLLLIFRKLSMKERMAAIKGVRERIRCGEYDSHVPTLENYLRKKLWERPLRLRARASPDRKAAARQEAIRRIQEELEDAERREVHAG